MKVVAYVHPDRVGGTETGVAKHIREMVVGLYRRPGIELKLMAPRKDWEYGERRATPYPFAGLPRINLPGRRKWLEKVWAVVNAPAVDRWCPGADWVYCPMEAYVPTRKARLAVTAHGMEWFEPDAPWYADCHRERARWRFKFGPVLRKEDALILAVSGFMKQRLVELFGVRPERVEVVGNGVEPAFFAAADTPVPEGGPRYVLVVGGLQTVKGGDRTLAVAEELRRRGSDIQVWAIGSVAPRSKAGRTTRKSAGSGSSARARGCQTCCGSRSRCRSCPGTSRSASRRRRRWPPARRRLSRRTGAPGGRRQGRGGGRRRRPGRSRRRHHCRGRRQGVVRRPHRAGSERAKELTWDRCVDRLLAALGRPA